MNTSTKFHNSHTQCVQDHHSELICFPTMSACGSSCVINVFMALLWQLKALGLAKERAQTKSKNLTKATNFHQPSVFVV